MMKIRLISCLFVLDSEKNINIRKKDIKKIKILVTKNNELPSINVESSGIKEKLKKNISSIIGSNVFHLEQVFTMDSKDSIDIIYLAITNIENIKKLKKDYELIDFKLQDNSIIIYGKNLYNYKTIELIEKTNIEYIHEIETKDSIVKKNLLYLLICYKRIRSNLDNTDIIFKFMGSSFTLEDVRLVYELLKDSSVDKSNFRKKIIKYCEKIDDVENDVKYGFRPSQKYKFTPVKGDVWL